MRALPDFRNLQGAKISTKVLSCYRASTTWESTHLCREHYHYLRFNLTMFMSTWTIIPPHDKHLMFKDRTFRVVLEKCECMQKQGRSSQLCWHSAPLLRWPYLNVQHFRKQGCNVMPAGALSDDINGPLRGITGVTNWYREQWPLWHWASSLWACTCTWKFSMCRPW